MPIKQRRVRLYNGEKTTFPINSPWKNWAATCERIKLDYFII